MLGAPTASAALNQSLFQCSCPPLGRSHAHGGHLVRAVLLGSRDRPRCALCPLHARGPRLLDGGGAVLGSPLPRSPHLQPANRTRGGGHLAKDHRLARPRFRVQASAGGHDFIIISTPPSSGAEWANPPVLPGKSRPRRPTPPSSKPGGRREPTGPAPSHHLLRTDAPRAQPSVLLRPDPSESPETQSVPRLPPPHTLFAGDREGRPRTRKYTHVHKHTLQ